MLLRDLRLPITSWPPIGYGRKLIENFADVGYDGSLMTMMSYDWRLGLSDSRSSEMDISPSCDIQLKLHVRSSGEKVVLISHSMGGTVVMYFLAWVTADVKDGGGGGGKDWVEKHIHSFVNIAGTLLGST